MYEGNDRLPAAQQHTNALTCLNATFIGHPDCVDTLLMIKSHRWPSLEHNEYFRFGLPTTKTVSKAFGVLA